MKSIVLSLLNVNESRRCWFSSDLIRVKAATGQMSLKRFLLLFAGDSTVNPTNYRVVLRTNLSRSMDKLHNSTDT